LVHPGCSSGPGTDRYAASCTVERRYLIHGQVPDVYLNMLDPDCTVKGYDNSSNLLDVCTMPYAYKHDHPQPPWYPQHHTNGNAPYAACLLCCSLRSLLPSSYASASAQSPCPDSSRGTSGTSHPCSQTCRSSSLPPQQRPFLFPQPQPSSHCRPAPQSRAAPSRPWAYPRARPAAASSYPPASRRT